MKTFVPTILITTLAVTTGDCLANTWPDLGPRQTVVLFADLNPDTPEGAKVLFLRLKHAAEDVCSETPDTDLAAWGRARACT